MGKTDFEELIKKGVKDIDKKAESQEARDAFKVFVDKPIPGEVDIYEWEGREILIEIFKYAPITEGAVQISVNGDTSDINKVRYFSFAKILAAGPESNYTAGDVVKLRDTDVLSIETAKYSSWVSNPMSKSNLKQKGEEPARFLSNIFKSYGPSAFVLNPFNLQKLDSHVDDAVYKVSDAKVENKVKDVNLLF